MCSALRLGSVLLPRGDISNSKWPPCWPPSGVPGLVNQVVLGSNLGLGCCFDSEVCRARRVVDERAHRLICASCRRGELFPHWLVCRLGSRDHRPGDPPGSPHSRDGTDALGLCFAVGGHRLGSVKGTALGTHPLGDQCSGKCCRIVLWGGMACIEIQFGGTVLWVERGRQNSCQIRHKSSIETY